MNAVWLVLILMGVAVAGARGEVGAVTEAATAAAEGAIETAFHLAGVMALWLGLARVAEEAGMMQGLARLLGPLTRRLFPSVPRDHPALGSMAMNLSANLLGLGNAATPLGLKAMQDLQSLNRGDPQTATPAMITFLVLNTSSVTLIPGTLIALRAAHGSANPGAIVVPSLVATLLSAAAGLATDALCRRLWGRE
ncbi:MAG: spore maturation protein [Firmicutes bacterium]|nr:spore maturation protein [Bacillota bacterium]